MHRLSAPLALIASIVASWVSSSTLAQCELQWDEQFVLAGANQEVWDSVVYDSGDGPNLYIGGTFNTVGGQPISYIARYDGANWHALGDGLNSSATSMVVFDDGNGPQLYVAGNFTQAGGQTAQRLARWDGRSWSVEVGGVNDPNSITSMHVSDALTGTPRLYVCGTFTSIGGQAISRLAAFDGAQWSAVTPSEFTFAGALIAFDDPQTPAKDLFVMGSRPNPDPKIPTPQAGFFRFDGTNLTFIAGNLNPSSVRVLDVYAEDGSEPHFYAGGSFTQTTDVPPVSCRYIARLDEGAWTEIGGGVNNQVFGLQVFDDGTGPGLYVGGWFGMELDVAFRVARWDGTTFLPLGTGINGDGPRGFTTWDDGFGSCLLVHGQFNGAGDRAVQGVALWDGAAWSALGKKAGVHGDVTDMLVDESNPSAPRLIVASGGQTFGDAVAKYIAAWDGARFSAIGSGFLDRVSALEMFDAGDGKGPCLVAGGWFTQLGDFSLCLYAARWVDGHWEALPGCPLTRISDLITFDDGSGPALYAVSELAGGHIAKWDGKAWSSMGGLDAEGRCLYVFDDGTGEALYVGGRFRFAGGVEVNRIAKWDGEDWTSLAEGIPGPGFSPVVESMCAANINGRNVLVVGGGFHSAGTVPAEMIAQWDGKAWSALPNSEFNDVVNALSIHDDGMGPALYAAGVFTSISEQSRRLIAKWNGDGWDSVAFGLATSAGGFGAQCLASFSPDGGSGLYVGGYNQFYCPNIDCNPPLSSKGLARWHTCLAAASAVQSPPDQSAAPGSTVTLEVGATGGDVTYRWRRDGVPLGNNATQTGVNTPRLTLWNVDRDDEGTYDVVLQNPAGSDTSIPADLTIAAPCVADIAGGDRVVGIDDLLAVISAWGPCPTPPATCGANIVTSGASATNVDIDDLLAVISAWGPCP